MSGEGSRLNSVVLSAQRRRWYRGYMESFLRNWRALRLDRRLLDAEVVMAGPLLLSFLTITWWLATSVLELPAPNGNVAATARSC